MINYAHRGASEYAPENTLSSFYLGLMQGANGIETDVQRTKDGELVLFHDDTLNRVTDGTGRISDYTLEELKKFKVYGNITTGFYDRIVTFREFLEKFSAYNIKFAIEMKEAGLEEDILALAKEFDIMQKSTFTSFKFDCIKRIKEVDPTARVGWLISDPNDEAIEKLLAIGGEEMAPQAANLTEERNEKLRNCGLGVRAWGISNRAIMKKMCDMKVDGMTVNFPDSLFNFLNAEKI